ncbi:MAG TPA: hypothetical protein VD998_03765 [Verrucomicrobiae bacterium]|nr:hypothetical protein [Verrucomicrobiae bacterium]
MVRVSLLLIAACIVIASTAQAQVRLSVGTDVVSNGTTSVIDYEQASGISQSGQDFKKPSARFVVTIEENARFATEVRFVRSAFDAPRLWYKLDSGVIEYPNNGFSNVVRQEDTTNYALDVIQSITVLPYLTVDGGLTHVAFNRREVVDERMPFGFHNESEFNTSFTGPTIGTTFWHRYKRFTVSAEAGLGFLWQRGEYNFVHRMNDFDLRPQTYERAAKTTALQKHWGVGLTVRATDHIDIVPSYTFRSIGTGEGGYLFPDPFYREYSQRLRSRAFAVGFRVRP